MLFPYVAVTEGSNSFTLASIDQDFADRAGLVSTAANAVSAALTLSFIRVNSWWTPFFFSIEAYSKASGCPQSGLRHNSLYT
jgi:hypothetical protein